MFGIKTKLLLLARGGVGEHTWKNYLKRTLPEAGLFWRISHYIDFQISRIRYPGLDGRDYFIYRFYQIKHDKKKTFITEGDLKRMVIYFNGELDDPALLQVSDKAKFNSIFKDRLGRRWISGDEKEEDIIRFCVDCKEVFVKPENGGQGSGIRSVNIQNENDARNLYNELRGEKYLLEARLRQHPEMAKLHPQSVNTLRLYTVCDPDRTKVKLTAAVLRIGQGDSVTDNWTAGGMAAEIDPEKGVVVSPAADRLGKFHTIHPDTGENIVGFQIPEWDNIVKLVCESHMRLEKLRYIAWDAVVAEDGTGCLLEGNHWGGVALQQQPGQSGKKEIYRNIIKEDIGHNNSVNLNIL